MEKYENVIFITYGKNHYDPDKFIEPKNWWVMGF